MAKIDPARADAILQRSAELFLAKGYAKVSMSEILAGVGGSMRDLYAEFGGKDELFRRVVESVCLEVLAPLETLTEPGHSTKEAMRLFGGRFLRFMLSPRVLDLQRLVMAEARQHPHFAQTFLRNGPMRAHGIAAVLLRHGAQRGEYSLPDPTMIGSMFCDMLVAELQFRSLAGQAISESDIDRRVEAALGVLFHGLGGSGKLTANTVRHP